MGKILWLITARSGSKSVPNKNIKLLGGIPLLAYRILTATKCSYSSEVWLSTDSEEYAEIGRSFNAEVPFIRPEHLSTDTSSSIDTVLHAMEYAEDNNHKFDYIGLLEPTSPFIYPSILDDALDMLNTSPEASGIVAVKEARPSSFFLQKESKYLTELYERFKNQNLNRQNFKKEITPSGGFYISRWDAFKKERNFYTGKTLAYEVPNECHLEIDEKIDWDFAEFLLEKNIVDKGKLLL